MINIINTVFPVLMFGISTLCVLVLLLYFFKKENLLRRIGFMKNYSLLILWSGLAYSLLFGLFGIIQETEGEFSIGIQAFFLVACLLGAVVLIGLIISWRSKIQAS